MILFNEMHMSEYEGSSIPYDTPVENIEELMEKLRDSAGLICLDRINYGQKTNEKATIRTCITFGLIKKEENTILLTDLGRNFVYNTKSERSIAYLELINKFPPYSLIFAEITRTGKRNITKTEIRNIWGINNFNISQRCFESAIPLLFTFFEKAKLGTTQRAGQNREASFEFYTNFPYINKPSASSFDSGINKEFNCDTKKIIGCKPSAKFLDALKVLQIEINSKMSPEQIDNIFDQLENLIDFIKQISNVKDNKKVGSTKIELISGGSD